MVLWKLFQKAAQKTNMPATFRPELLQRPTKFKFGYSEMVQQYEVALWMTQNHLSPKVRDNIWITEANNYQREVNYHWGQISFRRCLLFLIAMYGFGQWYGKPRHDWQDSHDPKYEGRTYGDLEEGGDEGGDDD